MLDLASVDLAVAVEVELVEGNHDLFEDVLFGGGGAFFVCLWAHLLENIIYLLHCASRFSTQLSNRFLRFGSFSHVGNLCLEQSDLYLCIA